MKSLEWRLHAVAAQYMWATTLILLPFPIVFNLFRLGRDQLQFFLPCPGQTP